MVVWGSNQCRDKLLQTRSDLVLALLLLLLLLLVVVVIAVDDDGDDYGDDDAWLLYMIVST